MRMDSVAEWAAHYAAKGLPVFPCKPDKTPHVAGGFKTATTDARSVASFWAQWPNAMIGMPTGVVSGVWVLDVDVKNGVDGRATLAALVGAITHPALRLRVRTPSGGLHLHYAIPDGAPRLKCSAGKLGPGLDVRADGGYIILPPSRPAPDAKAYEVEDFDAPL